MKHANIVILISLFLIITIIMKQFEKNIQINNI